MKCEVCDKYTRINWGNASIIRCETHSNIATSKTKQNAKPTSIATIEFKVISIIVVLVSHLFAFTNVLHSCLLLSISIIGMPLVLLVIPILIYWAIRLALSFWGYRRAISSVLFLDMLYIMTYLSLQGTRFSWPQINIMEAEIHAPTLILILSFYYLTDSKYEQRDRYTNDAAQ